ncbi:MAG: alanine racemase [Oscillospiraceae bacterium]|nr:alanine racemase [Oscillospiraceae bacterium]
MESFLKRTWIEINSDALEKNYRNVRNIVNKNSKIMCVVKADAYGHGAGFLSRLYQNLGADWLAVSNLEEAIQIRKNGVYLPILVLGHTQPNMVNKLALYSITQTVASLEYAKELSQKASYLDFNINIHIKLDTGMNRMGLVYQDESEDECTINEIREIFNLKHLIAKGLFTHFSESDNSKNPDDYTAWQFNNFKSAIKKLRDHGIEFKLNHCSNSGAILNYPHMNMDMVRAGIILYGLLPSNKIKTHTQLHPAMQWKTTISQIKKIKPNSAVSYNRTFYAKQETVVAVVPVGYADGYPRILSSKAKMMVCGKKAPIVGAVCMDQLILDISNIPGVTINSIVTIFGQDNDEKIDINELAFLSNRINYELICVIGKRVTRIFLKKGKIIEKLNYICPTD